MKKIKLEKLDFKKTGIIELNLQQLTKINGGSDTEPLSGPRTITTTSLTCPTEDGTRTHSK